MDDDRAAMTRADTVGERLDLRYNALNMLRLTLASMVIVSHAAPIGGFGEDPHLGELTLGGAAVGGFFAISGFLITQSRFNTPLKPFAIRRLLRIFPGYWLCLLVTAFGITFIAGLVRGGWTPGAASTYAFSSIDMVKWVGVIGSTLEGLPLPTTWNGSLWTLRHELLCYALVGAVLCLSFARSARRAVTAVAFVVSSLLGVLTPDTAPQMLEQFAFLAPYFAAGALLFAYADRVPVSSWLAGVSAIVLLATVWTGATVALGALPLAYLCFWIGIVLPDRLKRVGSRNDVSYGMYLYGFPVQQLLVVLGVSRIGFFGYALACLVCTVPLAWFSWLAVERPAMALGRRLTHRRAGVSPPAAVPPDGR